MLRSPDASWEGLIEISFFLMWVSQETPRGVKT